MKRTGVHAVLSGLTLCAAVFSSSACQAKPGKINVDLDKPIGSISPYIYGSNHDIDGFQFTAARRLGGNRLTGYNWEIDASHAGNDYRHQHDRWLTKQPFWKRDIENQGTTGVTPGETLLRFHRESLDRGAYSLVTVPMAGFVAGDADGPVQSEEAAPSARWARVEALSPSDAAMSPDDDVVYADQMVSYLVKQLGGAGDKGIRGYSLDNEPGLWSQTHPRLHPKAVTCEELLNKSVATAAAIKSVDPNAETYGPALWGMSAYVSLQQAEDWPSLKQEGKYAWFIDAYLDTMSKASQIKSQRLLDVLDVHWYTQDPKGRPMTGAEAARSARALYDLDHVEPNWVGKHFKQFQPLLPRLQKSIDAYYPGTKIAISEYDWPMTGEVYGGLAQADALGAFGKHGVYFAAYHHRVDTKKDRYVAAAFNLFCNYDGEGSTFGSTALEVKINSEQDVTSYASLADRGALHLVLINLEEKAAATLTLTVGDRFDVKSSHAWAFDADSTDVVRLDQALQASRNQVQIELAPLSATHLIVPKAD